MRHYLDVVRWLSSILRSLMVRKGGLKGRPCHSLARIAGRGNIRADVWAWTLAEVVQGASQVVQLLAEVIVGIAHAR